MTFNELGLKDEILSSLNELGFEKPTPIQEKSIPVLLNDNRDYVGLAQTGTGKTAAFGLPLIQSIDINQRAIQGLILCPTRELCLQITNELENYSKHVKGVKVVAVYGGASITDQIRKIKKGVNIVVGTPGRTIDLINRKVLSFDKVSTLVLDEADEMLNMGFKEEIDKILEATPAYKRTWLFSATMPKDVERIASNYMTDPFKITIGDRNSSAKNIEHLYAIVKGRDHYEALRRFIDIYPEMFGIVFCRTRRDAKEIAEKLTFDGCNADALHGDLSQQQRDTVMNKFRKKTIQVLVATDVAARGIDVDDVTHVFHIEIPEDIESYTHRSGRTARAGKHGTSLALVSPHNLNRVRMVEKQIGKKLELVKAPTGEQICEQQLFKLIQNVHDVEVDEKGIGKYFATIMEQLEEFDKEELVARFISVEFNRFLKTYKRAGDINIDPSKVKVRGDRNSGRSGRNRKGDDRFSSQNQKRVYINVGRLDGFENKGQILGFLCNNSGIDGADVGKIDVFDSFSFVGVADGVGSKLIDRLNGKNVENRELRVEFSKDKPKSDRGGGRKGRSRDRGGEKRSGGGRRYSRR